MGVVLLDGGFFWFSLFFYTTEMKEPCNSSSEVMWNVGWVGEAPWSSSDGSVSKNGFVVVSLIVLVGCGRRFVRGGPLALGG